MASLAEIRAKLKAQENGGRQYQGNNENGDLLFAHWNMQDGESTVVRFLPDSDPDNVYFWRERQLINLTFAGVKGQEENRPVTIKVPCAEMWGDQCPILNEIRPWWKDPEFEDLARKYWKKRSYFMQGFVVDTTIREEKTPENPIRKFIISPQIFNVIKASLMDPELESLPTDYENGLNFTISRTSKSGFNDYTTSKWSRRESALTEAQRAAIKQYGLFDMKDWLPPRPSADALKAQHEMFEASVAGELYDVERWGEFYRPYGLDAPSRSSGSQSAPAPSTTPEPQPAPAAPRVEEPKPEPATVPAPAAPAPSEAPTANAGVAAKDILAKIRSRNAS